VTRYRASLSAAISACDLRRRDGDPPGATDFFATCTLAVVISMASKVLLENAVLDRGTPARSAF
jgi:hypothetical protein